MFFIERNTSNFIIGIKALKDVKKIDVKKYEFIKI